MLLGFIPIEFSISFKNDLTFFVKHTTNIF